MALGQYCRASWKERMIQLLPNALCANAAGGVTRNGLVHHVDHRRLG